MSRAAPVTQPHNPTVRHGRLAAMLAVSILIVAVIGLQAMATFRVLCPPESIRALAPLRVGCAPAAWPILDYPMYWVPHQAGESIPRPEVVGMLADGSQRPVRAEDLGLTFWLYQDFLIAVDQADPPALEAYVQLYRQRTGQQLISLRLVHYPVIITDHGLDENEPRLVREVRLTP